MRNKDDFHYHKILLNFNSEIEEEYSQESFRRTLKAFQIVMTLVVVMEVSLSLNDFFRIGEIEVTVLFRLIKALVYFIIYLASFAFDRGVKFQLFVGMVILLIFISYCFQDYYGVMQAHFLGNGFVTMTYFVFTVSGLFFRQAFLLVFILQMIYLFYFPIIGVPIPIDQIPSILVNNSMACLIGFLFEKSKREVFRNESLLKGVNEKGALLNKKLKNYNVLKDRLLSVVSHDVKSPLNSIQSILQLLNTKSLSPEETVNLFRKMEDQINGTIGYVEKILHWTKSQMGGFKIKMESCNLYEMVEQSCLDMQRPAQMKNITFRNEVNRWSSATADKEILDIVLRNLIGNAIKFSYEKSEIAFRNEADGNANLIIQDFGVGISTDRAETIFDFNHDHTVGTKLERGSGIGLTLCSDFMSKIGGTLSLVSEVNKGSTFTLNFPVEQTGIES